MVFQGRKGEFSIPSVSSETLVSADSVSFKSKQAHSSFQEVPLKRLPCLKCSQAQLGMVQATDPQRAGTKGRCTPPWPWKMLPGSSCPPGAERKAIGAEDQVRNPGAWLLLCKTSPAGRGTARNCPVLLLLPPFLTTQGFIYWPRFGLRPSLFNTLSTKCPPFPAIYESPGCLSGHTLEFVRAVVTDHTPPCCIILLP